MSNDEQRTAVVEKLTPEEVIYKIETCRLIVNAIWCTICVRHVHSLTQWRDMRRYATKRKVCTGYGYAAITSSRSGSAHASIPAAKLKCLQFDNAV